LLRAMICQLAVFHAPDRLLIAGVIGEPSQIHWDWLKWLPHHQHPWAHDGCGAVRMRYPSMAAAETAFMGLAATDSQAHLVLIVDHELDGGSGPAIDRASTPRLTTLVVGSAGSPGMATSVMRLGIAAETLTVTRAGQEDVRVTPDQMDPQVALVCARRLAGYHVSEPETEHDRPPAEGSAWRARIKVSDIADLDPSTLWRNQSYRDRLRVPIGATSAGRPLELDIKEAAEQGMGPHGLCIGATGSGKSELLRTVALGLMALNSPQVLNLILIDFKGGATFLGMERAPQVAAVITNLAEEEPLVARMREALTGEMNRRQQLLRAAGNMVSVAAYEDARRSGKISEKYCGTNIFGALPTLCIIVDEFSELLSQYPDFVDVFVAIGRLGRSLGMYLLLASQRVDEARLRGLEAHLSYRICLKTLSANESRTVLGVPDAYQLPNKPGAGFLRTGPDELIRFQAASVSVRRAKRPVAAVGRNTSSVRLFTARASGSITAVETGGKSEQDGQTTLEAVLDRLSGLGPRAHQVWLPPLGAAPTLDSLLRVEGAPAEPLSTGLTAAIGVVDRPFEQCRTPLFVDLAGSSGNVAVVGAPQSGKSAALRTLIFALAISHDPRAVQFYGLDFGGGTLAAMSSLPHMGAVATRTQPELVARMIDTLQAIVHNRAALFRDHGLDSMSRYRQVRAERPALFRDDPFGDVFLVIDGWPSLRRAHESVEQAVTDLADQGLSFGVHLVLTASRWAEIRACLKDRIGTRIELRLGDPADSEVDRKRAQLVPLGSPGRGLSPQGLHMAIALSRLDQIEAMLHRYPNLVAPPIRLLPTRVDQHSIVARASGDLAARVLLGLEERELAPVAVDFDNHGHLLIFGDSGCGKTATLRTLCREIVRTGAGQPRQLFIVDFRRTLLGVVEADTLSGYAPALPAVEDLLAKLRDRLRQPGPDCYLVVDDYHVLAASAGNQLNSLVDYLPQAADYGLHVVLARRSGGAARALYEPLLAGLKDLGCLGLFMSGCPDEGPLIGSHRPMPLPAGRGVLVTSDGRSARVQVGWTEPP
ncbi:MAG: type VII secretion protein EccCb, partial [Mycobacteriaceae bacterium]|nr:type VII secretion protein EccCb [Mycobacteriaceae bacterium]